jgi:hypothetical protein
MSIRDSHGNRHMINGSHPQEQVGSGACGSDQVVGGPPCAASSGNGDLSARTSALNVVFGGLQIAEKVSVRSTRTSCSRKPASPAYATHEIMGKPFDADNADDYLKALGSGDHDT